MIEIQVTMASIWLGQTRPLAFLLNSKEENSSNTLGVLDHVHTVGWMVTRVQQPWNEVSETGLDQQHWDPAETSAPRRVGEDWEVD